MSFYNNIEVERVEMDEDDPAYTTGGRYFGTGAPIFRCSYEDDTVGEQYITYVRAESIEAARSMIDSIVNISQATSFQATWGRE